MNLCRLTVSFGILALVLCITLMCQAATEHIEAADAFRARVADLEFAQYLARTALLAEDLGSTQSHLLELIDILLGTPDDPGSGLLDWAEDEMRSSELMDIVRPSQRTAFSASMDYVDGYLRVALAEAQLALDQLGTSADSKANIQAAFSFLSSALGTPDEPLSLGGLRVAASYLPPEIVVIGPDIPIEEATAKMLPGSLLFLDTGEYSQGTLTLSRSIWIARYPGASSTVRLMSSENTPAIIATNGAQVELSDLTVCDSSIGLLLQEKAIVHISDVSITGHSLAGVVASDQSSLTIQRSAIRSNLRYGLRVTDTSRVFLSNSDISLNVSAAPGAEGAGICAQDAAMVTGTQCELFANRGYGIWGMGESTIVLSGSRIIYSRNGGIHLQEHSKLSLMASHVAINGRTDLSLHVQEYVERWSLEWNPSHEFAGSIEGFGNTTDTSFEGLRVCLGGFALPDGFFIDSGT